jgi:hypothetical protein
VGDLVQRICGTKWGSRRGQLGMCTLLAVFKLRLYQQLPLGAKLRNCQLQCAYYGNISKTPPFQSSVDHLWKNAYLITRQWKGKLDWWWEKYALTNGRCMWIPSKLPHPYNPDHTNNSVKKVETSRAIPCAYSHKRRQVWKRLDLWSWKKLITGCDWSGVTKRWHWSGLIYWNSEANGLHTAGLEVVLWCHHPRTCCVDRGLVDRASAGK